jgi:hypothetical protein
MSRGVRMGKSMSNAALQAFLDLHGLAEAAVMAAYACPSDADWAMMHQTLSGVLDSLLANHGARDQDGWEVDERPGNGRATAQLEAVRKVG